MRINIFLLIMTFISSCSNKTQRINSTGINYKNDTIKERSRIIIDTNQYIKASIEVIVKSRKKVIAKLTLVNTLSDSLLLYKPLLPNDSPKLSIFIISTHDTYEPIELSTSADTTLSYYSGTYDVLPVLVPNFEMRNFVNLPAQVKISFSMNLADFYNFDVMLKEGIKRFDICYLNLFPEVKSMHALTQVDKNDGMVKPVYLSISSCFQNNSVKKVAFVIN